LNNTPGQLDGTAMNWKSILTQQIQGGANYRGIWNRIYTICAERKYTADIQAQDKTYRVKNS
jgi:hypothetical protein